MRRRWKALAAVGAVALFAGLLNLLPPRDDGLDWLRKYGGNEAQNVFADLNAKPPLKLVYHSFEFSESMPSALITELRRRRQQITHKSGEALAMYVPGNHRSVTLIRATPLNFIEYMWFRTKFGLGWSRPAEP